MHIIKAYNCKINEGNNKVNIKIYDKTYLNFYIDSADEYPGLIMQSDLLRQKSRELRCFYPETSCELKVRMYYNINGKSCPVVFCNYTPICIITEEGVYTPKFYIKSNGLYVEDD